MDGALTAVHHDHHIELATWFVEPNFVIAHERITPNPAWAEQ
jgi:hypothetical protein